MRVFGHLTKKQLSDYSLGSIGESAIHEFGRHLLGCESCRAELPLPTSQQFRKALLNESILENDELVQDEPTGLVATVSTLINTLRHNPTLALTSAALLVLLGLSAMMLFNGTLRPNSDKDVARSYETDGPLPTFKENDNRRAVQTETNASLPGTANSKAPDSIKNFPTSKASRQALTANSQNRLIKKSADKLPSTEQENISATRGGSPTCGDQQTIGFEFAATSGSIVLKWEKVPKAIKYHLYISDEEEILVDEYETSKETSYFLKKTLDTGKVYKWKVVIQLENGQTMIGVSQKFTSKDFQPSSKGTLKRLSAEIRCSSSN